MKINISIENGRPTLHIKGKINSNTCNDLEKKLMDSIDSNCNVVLNFKEVDYISSAGLRVLLSGEKKAKAAGAGRHRP